MVDQTRLLGDHCDDHCAPVRRPQQPLSDRGNGSTSFGRPVVPPKAVLVVHGMRRRRAAAIKQKQDFPGLGD